MTKKGLKKGNMPIKCILIKYTQEHVKFIYTDVTPGLSEFIYQIKIEFADNTVSNN